MKLSKKTVNNLTAVNHTFLHHSILCNSVILGLIVMPAMADLPDNTRQYVTDDITVVWDGDNVSNQDYLSAKGRTDQNSSFGGRVFVDRGSNLTILNSLYENITFDGAGTVLSTRTPKDGLQAILTVSGTSFKNNHALGEGGAIGNYNLLTINNSTFDGNTALLSKDSENNYTNVVDSKGNGGGALFLGSSSSTSISISDTGFLNNKSATLGGAIATRFATNDNGSKNDNSHAMLDIDASFIGNNAQKGGAIYNSFYADNGLGKGEGVTVTGVFAQNTAAQGGAIYNDGDLDKKGNGGIITLTDVVFTGNKASDKGGAIYNAGKTIISGEALFRDNTDGTRINDIYNVGTLNLNAAENKVISLVGGIDGNSGIVDLSGSGTVEIANVLKHQTVNVNTGELYLNDVDLTGSNVTVASGAMINTIDNLINDYTGKITLQNNAIIKGDIDYIDGAADKYSASDGATFVIYKVANALNVTKGETKDISVVNGNVTVNKDQDFAWFNGESGLNLESSGEANGKIKVTGLTGGINTAVDVTESEKNQEIAYNLTQDEIFNGDDNIIQKANFSITGNGIEDSHNTLAFQKDLIVDNESTLNVTNAKLAKHQNNQAAAIENREGGVLNVLNSKIDVDVRNHGIMYSDPTTYSGNVINTGTASFDGDVFASGAELSNSGTVNLISGNGHGKVTFKEGAEIQGTGITNLVSGQTQFNNTVSTNIMNLKSGADFAGTLTSEMLNTQNNNIDNVSGSVNNGSLYVDANLTDDGKIDSFANSTGATIQKINIMSSEYGNNEKLTMNVGGASLADDVEITGAMNYYTNVATDDSGNVVFSDKLVNTSNLYNKIGADWEDGTYIKSAANYENEADEEHLTVGQALGALDTAVAENTEAIETLNGDVNTNGSVAFMLNQEITKNSALTLDKAMNYTDQRIDKLDKELSDGVASAVALSSVAVSNVRKGEVSVGGGYGYYNGQSAMAVGAAMGLSKRWSINAGTGISGSNVSFRAGTNYKFKLF